MKFAAVLLLFGLTALAQEKTAVVAGSVVNSTSGVEIGGATVVLLTKNNNGAQPDYQAVTDVAGNFRISDVKPGEYIAHAQKRGFFPGVSPFIGPVHIGGGEDVPPLRFELIPPARLRGRVLGLDDKPAAKVEVALGGPNYGKTATTDENGDFVFQDVQPGTYGLMARFKHTRTYFPSAVDAALAEPITVVGGAEQSGYEIRLQPAPRMYRVRGVVLDATGKPAPMTTVEALPPSAIDTAGAFPGVSAGMATFSISSRPAGVVPESEYPAVTGPDGVFEFPALPERDWIFRVESEDHFVHAVAAVGVRNNIDAIDDLKIRLESPFDITGTVTLSDGSPAPDDATIPVMLRSLDGTPGAFSRSIKGALDFKNIVPGGFRVLPGVPAGGRYYVASVMAGTADATNQPVSLNAVSPPIRVILKLGSTIAGTVQEGAGATVLLLPQTLAPGDTGWLRDCGAGGSFEFAGLPPGDYYAVAIIHVDLNSLQTLSDLERLRVLVRDATAVRVEEGAVASVQLKSPR